MKKAEANSAYIRLLKKDEDLTQEQIALAKESFNEGWLQCELAAGWQAMETAPKNGALIDLLYPYPRGRTINCYWRQDDFTGPEGGWFWKQPQWDGENLLPEEQWSISYYPNMEPLLWMPTPLLPWNRDGSVTALS